MSAWQRARTGLESHPITVVWIILCFLLGALLFQLTSWSVW